MKIKDAQFQTWLKNPLSSPWKGLVIYGPDHGLVMENFQKVTDALVPDATDPFLVFNFDLASLKEDPTKLYDEATALSFSGDQKLIRLADASDGLTSYLKDLFGNTDLLTSFILISADNLSPRSSLRIFFESENHLAILPCYNDEQTSLSDVIKKYFSEKNIQIQSDALSYLVTHLGEDRRVTLMELEKIYSFLGDKKELILSDVIKCVGDSSLISLTDFCFSVTSGKFKQAYTVLERLYYEGVQPIAILRTLISHFHNLYMVKNLMAQGQNIDQAMRGIRPPIFFKYISLFKDSVMSWRINSLLKAMNLLLKSEIAAKKGTLSPEIVCMQTTLYLSKMHKK